MTSRTWSGCSVTHTGTLATMRGEGRSSAAAAASSAGLICLGDGLGPAQPQDRPVGARPGEAQHPRAHGGEQHATAPLPPGAPPIASTSADQMSPVNATDRSFIAGRSTDRYSSMCFAGVGERDLQRRLDARLVGEADPERQSIADRLLHGERLGGEHQRVAGPRRDDRGADLDRARAGAHRGDDREGIRYRQLRDPVRREARRPRPRPRGRRIWASGAPMATRLEPLIPMRMGASCLLLPRPARGPCDDDELCAFVFGARRATVSADARSQSHGHSRPTCTRFHVDRSARR